MKCWREPEELPVHKRNSGNGDRYQYMCGGGKRDKFCKMLSWASLVALLLLLSRFSHPVLLAGKVLPHAATGHWLGMESRAGPVLAHLLELNDQQSRK